MRIKTDFVPESARWYLTAGKEYEVFKRSDDQDVIITDDSDATSVFIPKSAHLDGRAWTIVEEDDE